ncbi:hypothetical protein BH24ACT6_BH24ACT6_14390 [soil metagenome]
MYRTEELGQLLFAIAHGHDDLVLQPAFTPILRQP